MPSNTNPDYSNKYFDLQVRITVLAYDSEYWAKHRDKLRDLRLGIQKPNENVGNGTKQNANQS